MHANARALTGVAVHPLQKGIADTVSGACRQSPLTTLLLASAGGQRSLLSAADGACGWSPTLPHPTADSTSSVCRSSALTPAAARGMCHSCLSPVFMPSRNQSDLSLEKEWETILLFLGGRGGWSSTAKPLLTQRGPPNPNVKSQWGAVGSCSSFPIL